MNRSRLIAAGTSVGALVAITAGVAAANPAPTKNHAAPANGRAATTGGQRSAQDTPAFGSDDQGQDNWQQLPPDPSATDPGLGSSSDQPPAFDPNTGSGISSDNNFGGSNTSSGGS
jgi:hypothetical protein